MKSKNTLTLEGHIHHLKMLSKAKHEEANMLTKRVEYLREASLEYNTLAYKLEGMLEDEETDNKTGTK